VVKKTLRSSSGGKKAAFKRITGSKGKLAQKEKEKEKTPPQGKKI